MTDHASDIAAREGGDFPDDPPAVKVVLYGRQFCAVKEPEGLAVSASGRGCLRVVAGQLLAAGYDADHRIELHRGGELVGKTTVIAAATGGDP